MVRKPKSLDFKSLASLTEAGLFRSHDELTSQVKACEKCGLCKARAHAVPGEGSLTPHYMFVGEAPGESEDESGRPFTGPGGQLLGKMIEAMHLKREEVYLTNVLKCKTGDGRKPAIDELQACLPYLHVEMKFLKPKVIVALGGTAAKCLLATNEELSDLRGKVHSVAGIPMITSFHPSYLAKHSEHKKEAWEDLKLAMKTAAQDVR